MLVGNPIFSWNLWIFSSLKKCKIFIHVWQKILFSTYISITMCLARFLKQLQVMILSLDSDSTVLRSKTPEKHTHIVNSIVDGITKTSILSIFLINFKRLSNILPKKPCSTGMKNVSCVEKNNFSKCSNTASRYHTSGMSGNQKTCDEN